jgi:integrase
MDRALDGLSVSAEATIDDVAAEVLKYYAGQKLKTRESFETAWRLHLEPFFSQMPISQVGDYWDKYRAYEKGQNPDRKLTHDRKHLVFILRWAERSGRLQKVPILGIDAADRRRQRGRILKYAEMDKLYAEASPKWQLKISLYQTGMRSGEVSSLRFSDIDMRTGFVTLRRENVKTSEARSFCIPHDVLLKIRKLKEESNSVFLFPHRLDPAKHETKTDKTFQRIKRRAGVTLKRHWFRHTAASAALNDGVAGAVLKKVFGMSERVLSDVYHHVDEDTARRVAKIVSKKVRGTGQ